MSKRRPKWLRLFAQSENEPAVGDPRQPDKKPIQIAADTSTEARNDTPGRPIAQAPEQPASEKPMEHAARGPAQPEIDALAQRASRAAQQILDNERLTASLDDDAAKILIDWGLACAEQVAQSTAGQDDVEAKEAMSLSLRATRRLMRLINRWIAQRLEMVPGENVALLGQIVQQAGIIYGPDYPLPSPARQNAFAMMTFGDDPAEIIQNLREFIENPT